ncbi:Cysteine-rich repeat secretory protein 55 [Vitis vinifera]|uniref:Cysteine-rich repeat secretory protein 55 n=1 Tax=Vitis vinifera TaxID=29760 RepID=A0A438DFY4_VITVI|nr:Cysteine-rich repeat secretory protein 55 [Vitis vinifera]
MASWLPPMVVANTWSTAWHNAEEMWARRLLNLYSRCCKADSYTLSKRGRRQIWFDYCFLRYSNKDFIGIDTGFGIYYYNVDNVTETERFNEELSKLMEKIRSQAVEPQNAGLGKGQTELTPFITLYALCNAHGTFAIVLRPMPRHCCWQFPQLLRQQEGLPRFV